MRSLLSPRAENRRAWGHRVGNPRVVTCAAHLSCLSGFVIMGFVNSWRNVDQYDLAQALAVIECTLLQSGPCRLVALIAVFGLHDGCITSWRGL